MSDNKPDAPRAHTQEEMQDLFLDQIAARVNYWAHVDIQPNKGETEAHARLSGLAFSILTILDGCSELPSFEIVPTPAEGDREFLIEEGENYWPPSELPENVATIHGGSMLHELYAARERVE